MPVPKKPAKTKSKNSSAASNSKTKSARAAAAARAKKNKKDASGGGLVREILVGVLTDIIVDLLKPESGWGAAMHKVGELIALMPFPSFVSVAREKSQATAEVSPTEYDQWANSIFLILVNLQMDAAELRETADKYRTPLADIAEQVAEHVVESTGIRNDIAYSEIKQLFNSYAFYCYLNVVLPSGAAERPLRRRTL